MGLGCRLRGNDNLWTWIPAYVGWGTPLHPCGQGGILRFVGRGKGLGFPVRFGAWERNWEVRSCYKSPDKIPFPLPSIFVFISGFWCNLFIYFFYFVYIIVFRSSNAPKS